MSLLRTQHKTPLRWTSSNLPTRRNVSNNRVWTFLPPSSPFRSILISPWSVLPYSPAMRLCPSCSYASRFVRHFSTTPLLHHPQKRKFAFPPFSIYNPRLGLVVIEEWAVGLISMATEFFGYPRVKYRINKTCTKFMKLSSCVVPLK